jgi:hypothetical protein
MAGFELYNPVLPYSPYISVTLGDITFDSDKNGPNFIRSMVNTVTMGYKGTFQITLTDWNDYDLEQKLARSILNFGKYPIRYQYGYSQGGKSPIYVGTVHDYTPTFNADMTMTYVLKGLCDEEFGSVTTKTYKSSDYGGRVSNIVKAIALDEGWKIGKFFAETDLLKTPTSYQRKNETAMNFIRNKIVPIATRNGNPVKLVHNSTSEGVNVYFRELDPKTPKVIKKEYNFVINGGNYGSVINFSPSYTGTGTSMLNTSSGFLEGDNKIQVFSNKGKVPSNVPDSYSVWGNMSPETLEAKLNNQWFDNNLGISSTTLEIVGDADFEVMDYINIIPLRPDGRIHHTGGTFMVKSIVHNIGGTFTTQLNLMKMPGQKTIKLDALI